MEPKYGTGQKVRIRPVKGESPSSARDSDIRRYAGQSGVVSDFYWIQPTASEVFYIYTVKIGGGEREVVLYEDEIETVK